MGLNTKFDELLDFPCPFPFKVLGVADDALVEQVVAVLQQHAPGDYSPTTKPSSKGNYLSVTVTVTAQSKEHLETMYSALGQIELVRVVL
jgi:putative lipoic acid-binding regulatory protein